MKKDKRFYLALVIFCLAGQVAWTVENMYLNVFIYEMFHASAAQISWMVGASSVAATVTTLLIGALSDKVGRRKVFICGGYILWGISIWAFSLLRLDVLSAFETAAVSAASLGVTLTIGLDCVMTVFGSSANDACFNAWLTDVSTGEDRGRIEGINAMMPLISILVVFGGFMSFDLGKSQSWVTIFSIIGLVMAAIGAAGFWMIREVSVETGGNQNYFGNIFYGFRPSVVRENPQLYLTLVCVAVFNISVQTFMPYLILYYTEALGMDNYVFVFAPAILLAAIFTGLYGRQYDIRPFRQAVRLPWILLIFGYVGLFFCRTTGPVFVCSLCMMCGFLSMGAMLGAKVRTHTPENRSGMFQGLRIVAQVMIPGIIGPGIGAAVLGNAETVVNNDGTTSFVPNESIFLAALAVALILACFLRLLWKNKEENHAV